MINDFNPSDIEDAVIAMVKSSGAAGEVYSDRPQAKTTSDAFAVVAVRGTVEDWAALGECVLEISLFARDVKMQKNSLKLSKMYDALIAGMKAEVGRYCIGVNPRVLGDAEDGYGFHARVLMFTITIKVQ